MLGDQICDNILFAHILLGCECLVLVSQRLKRNSDRMLFSERKLMCFRTRTPHQKIFALLGKTHWSACTTVDLVTRSIPFGCSISTAKFHPARHVCNRGHCHQHQPQPSTIVYVWTTKSSNGMECTMVRYRMGVEVERWQDVTCCNLHQSIFWKLLIATTRQTTVPTLQLCEVWFVLFPCMWAMQRSAVLQCRTSWGRLWFWRWVTYY